MFISIYGFVVNSTLPYIFSIQKAVQLNIQDIFFSNTQAPPQLDPSLGLLLEVFQPEIFGSQKPGKKKKLSPVDVFVDLRWFKMI